MRIYVVFFKNLRRMFLWFVWFYNLRVESCELRAVSCDFKKKNDELRVPFHEL